VYILAGPVAWITVGVLMYMSRRRMMIVTRPHLRIPQPPPRATILIPAKDEGQRIAACLGSALAQTYPNYSVIAIDDRSTDQTGQVMDRFAAEDPRLRVLHIREGELPAGWTGKCHAVWRGAREADGQWLLFVDSDVVIEPDALAATLATTARRNCRAPLSRASPRSAPPRGPAHSPPPMTGTGRASKPRASGSAGTTSPPLSSWTSPAR
jgi:cellulose synthase/poly-beta-1,6-N-acetylglucosamine synthase-like glycosyltransferase